MTRSALNSLLCFSSSCPLLIFSAAVFTPVLFSCRFNAALHSSSSFEHCSFPVKKVYPVNYPLFQQQNNIMNVNFFNRRLRTEFPDIPSLVFSCMQYNCILNVSLPQSESNTWARQVRLINIQLQNHNNVFLNKTIKFYNILFALSYPWYQRFFSRAAGIFGVGRRVTINT